jgi:hypothetical protein
MELHSRLFTHLLQILGKADLDLQPLYTLEHGAVLLISKQCRH